MSSSPLVSISCITFNHVKYIRQCLEGFLMQKCTFDFEILIHDDASTDGTSEIIREYHVKYPEIIKPIIQTKNQWSEGIRGISLKYNIPRAIGKYIAFCEGDDYWTDPLKLQKQVDFLELNPEYSLVSAGFKTINTITSYENIVIRDVEIAQDNTEKGFDITIERFFRQWLTKTLTLVYRNDFYNIDDFKEYKYLKDVHLNYHLLKKGKGYYIKEILGVYHIHEGGVFSLTSKDNKLKSDYLAFRELYKKNKEDNCLRIAYFNVIQKIIGNKVCDRDKSLKRNNLVVELLHLVRNIKDIKRVIKIIIT